MHMPKEVFGEFAGEIMKKAKNFLRVRDCMSVDPATVGPKDSLQKVIGLLRRRDIRSVPVIENGRLIGIVTDRDVRQVAPAYPLFRDEDEIRQYTENLTVTAAMTADPMTIAPDAPLVEADFQAVGQFFDDFGQVSDQDVIAALRDAGAKISAVA